MAANNRTITSANSLLYLSVAGLFDVAQRIQGFSADDVTNVDSISPLETSMGVDGRLSAGWAPVEVTQNITLQADSLSNDFFDTWWATQQTQRDAFIATGQLTVAATGKKYNMKRGFLKSYKPFSDLKRTIQSRAYVIVWQEVTVSNA